MSKKTKPINSSTETKTATLYYRIIESSRGGECHSDEPYSLSEPTYIEFKEIQLRKSQDGSFFAPDSIEVDKSYLDESYLFVIRVVYTTGHSFGTTYGKNCVTAIKKTKEEAIKEKNDIEKEYKEYKEGKKVSCYKQWMGYFENLESVNIDLVELKD